MLTHRKKYCRRRAIIGPLIVSITADAFPTSFLGARPSSRHNQELCQLPFPFISLVFLLFYAEKTEAICCPPGHSPAPSRRHDNSSHALVPCPQHPRAGLPTTRRRIRSSAAQHPHDSPKKSRRSSRSCSDNRPAPSAPRGLRQRSINLRTWKKSLLLPHHLLLPPPPLNAQTSMLRVTCILICGWVSNLSLRARRIPRPVRSEGPRLSPCGGGQTGTGASTDALRTFEHPTYRQNGME